MISLTVESGIATVEMNAPPVNGMNDAWVSGLHGALDTLERRTDWSVLVIKSALGVFCGGADLKQIGERFNQGIEAQLEAGRGYQALFARLEAVPKTTIAAIDGAALGGGLELALACDLRFASTRTKLGLPEAGLGLLPGAGGTQRLTWLAGKGTASRLILGAEVIRAEEALRLGILQWVVPADEFASELQALLQRLSAVPPHAAAACKTAIAAANRHDVDGFAVEVEGVRALLSSDETRTLVQAFLNRGK